MLDFYLSVNNSEEVVHIPVTPPSFSVTNSQSTETFESAGYGWIKIIGNTELRGVSWDGTFPVHDYPFRRDASMDGQEYYEKLKSWQKRKLPVRLVITSTGFANISINMAVAIEKLDFDVGTTGDLDYSIELGEVELLNDTEDTNMAQLDDLAARMDAVEKRLDSLENEKIYNYMDDNMPSWAKPTIQKLMDRGYLNGTGDNELGVYVLTFYLEFNFADVMPQMNVRQDSSLFGFYVYIALLALVLLGLDYWLRKKYIWK